MHDRRAADDAEIVAANIMRDLGFVDAHVTQRAGDKGLDIISQDAVAQVKWQAGKVGRPALQNLVGASFLHGSVKLLFFTRTGYSAQAVEYSNEVQMALFVMDLDGSYSAVNGVAGRLLESERSAGPRESQDSAGWPRTPPRVSDEGIRRTEKEDLIARQRRELEAEWARSALLREGRERFEKQLDDARQKQWRKQEKIEKIRAEGKQPRTVGKQVAVSLIHFVCLIFAIITLLWFVVGLFNRDDYSSIVVWVCALAGYLCVSLVSFWIAFVCGRSTKNSEVI